MPDAFGYKLREPMLSILRAPEAAHVTDTPSIVVVPVVAAVNLSVMLVASATNENTCPLASIELTPDASRSIVVPAPTTEIDLSPVPAKFAVVQVK